jgi:hypothetical protein
MLYFRQKYALNHIRIEACPKGESMRSAGRLKMGYYPLPESEAAKLRSLLVFLGPASAIDPCVGEGIALDLITKEASLCRFGVELDADRACMANPREIRTLQGNTFDAIAKPESSSLLYLNPPYDSQIGSVRNSRMERLFLEHTYRWFPARTPNGLRPFTRRIPAASSGLNAESAAS